MRPVEASPTPYKGLKLIYGHSRERLLCPQISAADRAVIKLNSRGFHVVIEFQLNSFHIWGKMLVRSQLTKSNVLVNIYNTNVHNALELQFIWLIPIFSFFIQDKFKPDFENTKQIEKYPPWKIRYCKRRYWNRAQFSNLKLLKQIRKVNQLNTLVHVKMI